MAFIGLLFFAQKDELTIVAYTSPCAMSNLNFRKNTMGKAIIDIVLHIQPHILHLPPATVQQQAVVRIENYAWKESNV
jgi:hypothetical protein